MSGRHALPRRREAVLETEIAVRAYAPRTRPHHDREALPEPDLILVLDTETQTDAGQALLFGSYRVYEASGRVRQEGLFHADDLDPARLAVLRAYVDDHAADGGGRLRLRSRRGFLREVFWPIAYKARALVVGFNLPFDLSRLAYGWRRARNGGFTLQLFESVDAAGRVWPDQFRPEVTVKSLGSKRNFIGFTTPARLDPELRGGGRAYRGRFLDLHTLAYTFTDRSLSLDAAAAEFGLPAGKAEVAEHGVLTPDYVDYNRQDVRLTWELYRALVAEWRRHPIELAPEQAFSPAAISKAYLRAAGVTPPAERSDVPVERLGRAMVAYYGGRSECRIRHVALPVRYVDFASMYPTTFALLRLWSWVIADRLTSRDATDEARALLDRLDREALLDPAAWPALAGVFCRVRPAGELLPVRARYAAGPADTAGAGVRQGPRPGRSGSTTSRPTSTSGTRSRTSSWRRSSRAERPRFSRPSGSCRSGSSRACGPSGSAGRSWSTRGATTCSGSRPRNGPGSARTRPGRRRSGSASASSSRLSPTAAPTASSPRSASSTPSRAARPSRLLDCGRSKPVSRRPRSPGRSAFPPLAASITGAARLLLAIAQAGVEARGGTYIACDTDSLLVVASEAGGLVACPGGIERLADGTPAVRALSWVEVDAVLVELDRLNPYARGTVVSLVKLEPENFATDGTTPVELWCVAGSAKRYVLYNRRNEQ